MGNKKGHKQSLQWGLNSIRSFWLHKFSYKFINKSLSFILGFAILLYVISYTFLDSNLVQKAYAAQTTIDADVNANSGMHRSTSSNTVFISDSIGYLFYISDGNANGGTCSYTKTTNGGITWSSPIAVGPINGSCIHVSIWYDRWTPGDNGTFIHIAMADTEHDNVSYNALNTSTDTLLLSASSPTLVIDGTSLSPLETLTSITKATDGKLYTATGTTDTKGAHVYSCDSICNSSENWSTVDIAGIILSEESAPTLLPQPNGDIIILQYNKDESRIESNIWNSTEESWTGWETALSTVNIDTTSGYRGAFSAVINHASYDVYLAAVNHEGIIGEDDDDIKTAVYSNATWVEKTDIITNGTSNISSITDVVLGINTSNGTVYALYQGNSNGTEESVTNNIYYKSSTNNMSTWSVASAAINSVEGWFEGLNMNLSSDERLFASWVDMTESALNGETVADLTPPAAMTLSQSGYRFFENEDSANVITPLADTNTGYTTTSIGQSFRLRLLMHVNSQNLSVSGKNFKLQYVARGSGTCSVPSGGIPAVYTDITTETLIAFKDNTSISDNYSLTQNISIDPSHAADTVRPQTYEELNTFTNSQSAINAGEDGLWDFSLYDNGAAGNTTYCIRVVESDGTLLNDYTVYPTLTIINIAPTLEQSAYRFYENVDSYNVNTAIAAQNTQVNLSSTGQSVRLKMLMHVSTHSLPLNTYNFKLQYVNKGTGTCEVPTGGTPSTYTDVTNLTPISFKDNPSLVDNYPLSANVLLDPTHSGHTIRQQTYEEGNDFTNSQTSVNPGEDALWDFSLYSNGAPSNVTYCFRIVRTDGTPLATYSTYPEITTPVSFPGLIDSTVSTDAETFSGAHSNTVFTTDQIGYSFYVDHSGACVYRKTINGGYSWGASVTVDTQSDCLKAIIWYDQWTPGDSSGTSIHILTADSTNNDIYYSRLDTTSDTVTTKTNISTASTQGGSFSSEIFPSIVKATDGSLYVAIADNDDQYVLKCSSTCSTDSNWTEVGLNPLSDSQDNDYLALAPLPSGDMLLVRLDRSNGSFESKVYSSNTGTWDSSWTNIRTSLNQNTSIHGAYGITVSKTDNRVYLAYITDNETLGDNDDIRTAIYSDGIWTESEMVVSNDSRGITDVTIALDEARDDIYVIYAARSNPSGENTTNLYYKRSRNNMGSWSDESLPINTSAHAIHAPKVNSITSERIYVTWFDQTNAYFVGNTAVDLHSWYDTDWQYRKLITIDHTKISGTSSLTNYPLLIKIPSDVQIALRSQNDGDDILFTAGNGITKLDHEIETFVNATGELVAWVRIPSLSATTDTDIYLYYGNPSASNQQNTSGVWNTDYKTVYHMSQEPTGDSGDIKDSTNTYHATSENMGSGARVGGMHGYAYEFDSTDDIIDTHNTSSYSTYTLEAWIKPDSSGESNNGRIIEKGQQGTEEMKLMLEDWGSGEVLTFQREFTGGRGSWYAVGQPGTGSYKHIVVTYDDNPNTDPKIYINGVLQTVVEAETPSGTAVHQNESYFIGNRPQHDRTWDGQIDEVRISDTIRPSYWIATEYNNQSNPSEFFSLESEELVVVDTPPTITGAATQKNASNGTNIPLETWIASKDIHFSVLADDPDTSDALQLCVEVKKIGVAFTNIDEVCGTGVAYTGNTITVSVTINDIADGKYHWQYRIKDAHGLTSDWKSYGENGEGEIDFGIDTAAPLASTATVFPVPNNQTVEYAKDTFQRNTTSSWGSPEIGGTWNFYNFHNSSFEIDGDFGKISVPANATRFAELSSVNKQDLDTTVRVKVEDLPTSSNAAHFYLASRIQPSGNEYYLLGIKIMNNSVVALGHKRAGGTLTQLGPSQSLASITPENDKPIWIRSQVIGSTPTTLKIKAWTEDQTQPTDWTYIYTDSEEILQSSGKVGIQTKTEQTSAITTVFGVDDLYVVAPASESNVDGSLSHLSAAWTTFNTDLSAVEKYEYSVGTTPGATDIKSWTNNGTNTKVTASGLNLKTNQSYYFNIRAVDNAGNTSNVVSSERQVVNPTLAFSISTSSISFTNLTGTVGIDTKTADILTSTNAYNGYIVKAYRTGPMRSTAGTTIPDFKLGTYDQPAEWGNNQCSGDSCGFGYTSSDTTINGTNKFYDGTRYAPFATTAPGDIVADNTSTITGTAVNNESFTITTKLAVPLDQPAGTYTTSVVYTVIPQY